MATSPGRDSKWRRYFLPALCLSVLTVLGLSLWLRPYLSARYLVWQLGRLDDASLSQITLDVDVNTYDHGLPEWCMFELKEATLEMLCARYGSSTIQRYSLDRPESTIWNVVQVDIAGGDPHFFEIAGGRGNDSVYFVLRHKPGAYDAMEMRLVEYPITVRH